MAKAKTYTVWAKIVTATTLEITADSLETALAKAQHLKEENFCEYHGDVVDGTFEILGLLEDYST